MTHVIDTHPLVWFLEDNPRLSTTAKSALEDDFVEIVVPAIVLVEVRYLYSARRIRISLDELYHRVLNASNCTVYPLDEEVVAHVPEELNIHDAIIVATAPVYRDLLDQPTRLITKDRAIRESGLVEVLW